MRNRSILVITFILYDTGIYGHTAVYYPAKGIILVFGGYRFRIHAVSASDELYSLDHATSEWSILQALPSNQVSLAKSRTKLPGREITCLPRHAVFSPVEHYFSPQKCVTSQNLRIRSHGFGKNLKSILNKNELMGK